MTDDNLIEIFNIVLSGSEGRHVAAAKIRDRLEAAEAAVEQLLFQNSNLSLNDKKAVAAWRRVTGKE